jgi:Rieske Fe-S protein
MRRRDNGLQSPAKELQRKTYLVRQEANKKLDSLQKYMGLALLAGAAFGIYLLMSDKSLWLLAVSHAYGLIAICAIDIVLGITNLMDIGRKLITLSYVWAALTIILQIGDIVTAPQYKMSMQYFAEYLFRLWPYDAILVTQVSIIVIGLSSRRFEKVLVVKKQMNYFNMGLNKGRRDFIQIAGAIGGLIIFTAVLGALGSVSIPKGNSNNSGNGITTTTQTSTLPFGAIANQKDLQVGVPVYFDYPSSGYASMLLKQSDGSLTALSMLCTHVCCQCQYVNSSSEIACPCHGSLFDLNGNVLRGPAATKLPSIQLSIDSNGNIFPVKLNGSSPCTP